MCIEFLSRLEASIEDKTYRRLMGSPSNQCSQNILKKQCGESDYPLNLTLTEVYNILYKGSFNFVKAFAFLPKLLLIV